MSTVFVDIGSHFGESIVEVLKPSYSFDRIICLEPSSYAFAKLNAFKDARLEMHNWGAWEANVSGKLFSAGAVGGSLFDDKPQHWIREEIVELRDIREFFDVNFGSADQIYLKLNVEGAEMSILKKLFEKNSINWKVDFLLVSIDMHKVPSLKNRVDEVTKILKKSGVKYEFRKAADPKESIKIWLQDKPIHRKSSLGKWGFYYYNLPIFIIVRLVFRRMLPKKLWLFLALRFGPNRLKKF